MGALCSLRPLAVPAQAQPPGFGLSLQVAEAGAGCAGWLEDLPEPREEALTGVLWATLPKRATRPKGLGYLALALWLGAGKG